MTITTEHDHNLIFLRGNSYPDSSRDWAVYGCLDCAKVIDDSGAIIGDLSVKYQGYWRKKTNSPKVSAPCCEIGHETTEQAISCLQGQLKRGRAGNPLQWNNAIPEVNILFIAGEANA